MSDQEELAVFYSELANGGKLNQRALCHIRALTADLAALREELADRAEELSAVLGREACTEQRNAVMSKLLQRCIPVCRYKGSHTERQLINEIDATLNPPEGTKP